MKKLSLFLAAALIVFGASCKPNNPAPAPNPATRSG